MPSWEQVEKCIKECHDPRRHKDRLISLLKRDGWGLRFAEGSAWCKDREVVEAAVKSYGMALEFASPELSNDFELVIHACRQNGMAFMYASPGLKEDKELALHAVTTYGPAIEFCHPGLRDDWDVALAAIASSGQAMMFCRKLRLDKDFCIEALKNANCQCFEYIDAELRLDPDIVKATAEGARRQRKQRTNFKQLRERSKKDPGKLFRNASSPALTSKMKSGTFPAMPL